MYRRSLSNLLGGSLLVATVAGLNACGGGAAGGGDTPSAGTTGTPSGNTAGSTGTAGKSSSTPTTSGTAGTKAAAAGTSSTTSGVTTAGKSGGAGSTATGTAGNTGAAGGGTTAAAGGSATAAGTTGGAAGGGTAGGAAASGGTLGGPLMYTGEFTKGMTIDPKYKCPMDVIGGGMGENKSPALAWTGGPADTKSFAIVLFDTMYSALHWAMWDIPATVNMLPEGLPPGYELSNPMGAHQANQMGDASKHMYFGPCSSGGAAGTYEYRLYALKVDKLGLMESSTATMAQTAIESMMLEKAVWSGKPQ